MNKHTFGILIWTGNSTTRYSCHLWLRYKVSRRDLRPKDVLSFYCSLWKTGRHDTLTSITLKSKLHPILSQICCCLYSPKLSNLKPQLSWTARTQESKLHNKSHLRNDIMVLNSSQKSETRIQYFMTTYT